MKLKKFLVKYKIDHSANRIDPNDVSFYEELLGTKFGPQLREYILTYGYLGYQHIEMLGINSLQKEKSDMVKVTLRLRKRNPELKYMIAVDNQGDGDYYLVDSEDQIYRYLQSSKEPVKMNIDLESYIVNRLLGA